jgi:DNA-binding transcriptional MerR regulator
MKETKLKIGEFSQLMQVTVKALRHYEQIGILKPCEVDPWTGYRYYKLGQMQQLENIRHLKEVGFSLEEIREMAESGSPVPDIGQLESKIRACEEELKMLRSRRKRLSQMLDSQRKLDSMDKISIQSLPAIIVASHRETIPALEALAPLCVNVIGPEMQRLGCKCPPPGCSFTIDHGKEYSPTGIDIEYCEQVEEMGKDSKIIQFKKLEAVPTAVCCKHHGPYNRFHQSYAEVFKYIEQEGWQIVGCPRCCYIDGIWNQEDPEKWLSIIQVPVEKQP